MKRSTRQELAQQTVEIIETGCYTSPGGCQVELADALRACLDQTRYFSPADLEQVRLAVLAEPVPDCQTTFEVVNETTLSGIARLISSGSGPVAALNFASAKNPGGGFLNGSEAQEESLARSSGLYASLMKAWTFYEQHRESSSLLYSDAMILSPECPVIRNDDGSLLDVPESVAFITSPAPNAGAAASNRPEEVPQIPGVFIRRGEYVLALAASRGYKNLVLGAWGCGVFRNDPQVVSAAFMHHLRGPAWSRRFERVVFSVLDRSSDQVTFSAFQRALESNP